MIHVTRNARLMGAGFELYRPRQDGSEFPIDIMLSTLQAEGESLALAVLRNAKQRKQAEDALRPSEGLFRPIVRTFRENDMM